MNSKNFDVYFDFGTSKIRASAFNKNKETNSFNYESEFLFDHSNLGNEIETIISRLEKDTNEYLDDINIMIDSHELLSIGLSLFKNFDGTKLKKEDIKFIIQDAKQQILRSYQSQSIIHIIINNYKIDNVDYTFLPSNIICSELSIDVIFICLPKKNIKNIKEIFSKFNVSISNVSCSCYSKSISYKNNFVSSENILMIDMGFNKTSIIYHKGSKICFFYIIPIGGHHITKDISKILNINLIDAEKIKLNFDVDENALAEKKLSQDLITKIIFARVEEILELSIKYLETSGNFDVSDQFKIILTGEGSKILNNKFKEKISFKREINLLEENIESICESALKLNEGQNKQEVVIVPKTQIKEGFFEKLFLFFK